MNTELTTINGILAAVPESLELLGFGIGLVVAVIVLRWFLDRVDAGKSDAKFTNRV